MDATPRKNIILINIKLNEFAKAKMRTLTIYMCIITTIYWRDKML